MYQIWTDLLNFTKNDEQITTHSGDIVLYSGDKIVVFTISTNTRDDLDVRSAIQFNDSIEILPNVTE